MKTNNLTMKSDITLDQNFSELISDKEVVSFDIFDTLLFRDFYMPIDLFKYIEDYFGVKDFQKRRIAAEEYARTENYHLQEITLDMIYHYLPDCDKTLELELELKSSHANLDIKKLYDEAVAQNKRIIAISDMYLDLSFIQALLAGNGYHAFEKIYLSSNLKKTKAKGDLYAHVIEDLGIESDSLLHIGDNKQTDIHKAKEYGIHTLYCQSKRDQLQTYVNPTLLSSLTTHNTPQASILASTIAHNSNRYFAKENYWYRFGYEYAGVLIHNFLHYILAYCKKNNISRIYFMARDGEILKKTYDLLYNENIVPKSYYMYASRRLFHVPAIQTLNTENLDTLLTSSPGSSYRDILGKFGFEWLMKEAKQHFKDITQPIRSPKERESLKDFFLQHQTRIEEEISYERQHLLLYLEAIDFMQDSHKLIVDIGWHCSSQKNLESLLNTQIDAIYFATLQGAYHHDKIHGYFFDNGKPKAKAKLFHQALPVVELLFAGDHDSIHKVNAQLQPIYRNPSAQEQQRIEIAQQIHQGVLSFNSTYHKHLQKYHLSPDRYIDEITLKSLLENATMDDLMHVAEVPHSSSFGDASYTKIIEYFHTREGDALWKKAQLRYSILNNQKSSQYALVYNTAKTKIQHCLSYPLLLCLKKIWHMLLRRR